MLIQPPAKVMCATDCTVVILTKKNCIKEENSIMPCYTTYDKKLLVSDKSFQTI